MSARDAILALQAAMNAEVLGRPRVVERMVIGRLADGHLLIEGCPASPRPVPSRRWRTT